MRPQLVYDLPTRFFHWLFAGLFLTSFIISKTVDDDSPWFNFHSLAGLTLGFLVLLRILWGIFGTKHARFTGFALNPMDLVNYFKGILTGEKKRWAGHNPASSWAGITMMVLALCLAVTGYLMTSGPNKETFEDIHELFANGFIIIVVLHVAGIVLHTIRHQEMIGLSMFDGKKANVSGDQTISSSKSAFGILLIGLVVAFALFLFKNYNSQTRSLQFFGTTLQLSESDGDKGTQKQGMDEKHEAGEKDGDD
ncbi:MAG: cytochrome b/b6 domain-containing protein [Deltaproteobacteria bacterium]|jgi:cytochrome b|nr:cytochrome b/b6 domain-containing protein [Deltaproteobacteria bacterium]